MTRLATAVAVGLGLLVATAPAALAQTVFINELHYDNDGTDTGEAVEVAGPAGTDLTGWSLALYNGANGSVYNTLALSGALPDQQGGFGTAVVSLPTNGLQNGSPDGLALVDAGGGVVQFLSYEGTFTAVGGPADGLTSTDLGVSESSSTLVGESLQLTGTGSAYADFTWTPPSADSFGAPNAGQTFVGGPVAGGVLFSEYVEGSSFNKALEVYNATGAPVDLSAYAIAVYFNGNTTAGTTIALAGTLAPGDVYVVADDGADPAVLAVADQTTSSSLFNGDDAIVLTQDGEVVDAIGQIGVDPGSAWGSGPTSTQNNTLRRLATTCTGDADAFDAFDPAASWAGFGQDAFDDLGAYAASCGGGGGNRPPVFTAALADTEVPVGTAFSFDYDATDADADPLTFALADGPAGAMLDAVTGVFAWTPTAADAGQAVAVTVTVTDGTATVSTSATLTVEALGAGPAFTAALSDTLLQAGASLSFDYDTDASGAVTFSVARADGGPLAGASIDPATGLLVWTPAEPGVYGVTVTASTSDGASSVTSVAGVQGTLFAGEAGAALRASLRAAYAPAQTIGYGPARDSMYANVDREPDGSVVGVYTGFSVVLPDDVDPSAFLAANGINAEHTWPRSKGADAEPALSDVHNLFPTKDNVNSARSNKPFGEIPDAQTETWYRGAVSQTTIPTSEVDAWAESSTGFFEPREVHKGNAARAALYFFAVYEDVADAAFLLAQRDVLPAWDALDPADAAEVVRTYEIARFQGNVNPLLLDPTLAERLVADVVPPAPILIADARAEPTGTLVTVEGVVTRAEGRFARLQDASGPDGAAALTVFQSAGPFRGAVEDGTIAAGTSLRVTGTLTEFNGLLEIEPSSFEVLAPDAPLPAPQAVTLAELAADGEAYESELVTVSGLTLSLAGGPPGGLFEASTTYGLSDATAPEGEVDLRTPGASDTRIEGTPAPDGPFTFTGVLGEFRGTYQLQPIAASDVSLDDVEAPTIALVQEGPIELWPPNKRAVSFAVADLVASVSDDRTPLAVEDVVIAAVTSDEEGNRDAPIVLAGCTVVDLLADRDGRGDGRVYRITLAVADAAGNVGTVDAEVHVPKSQGRSGAAVDSGVAFAVDGCEPVVPAPPALAAVPAADGPVVAASEASLPVEVALEGNYPNPFARTTTLRFALPEAAHVRLVVYDLLGREVARVVDGPTEAGVHEAVLDGRRLAAGAYVARLTTDAGDALTRRLTVVR